MSKTDFNPKVSSIPQREGPVTGPRDAGPLQNQSTRTDTYSSSGSDQYRALLSGQAKATTTPIQEMLGANGTSSVPPSKRRLTGMDIFLEGFLMGDNDPGRASSSDFELPFVPEISSLLRRSPGIQEDIHGIRLIRDQYEGVVVTLQNLIANEEALQRDPQLGYYMTTDQIEAHTAHLGELKQRLFSAQQGLNKAQFYLDWARDSAEAARDQAQSDGQWWVEEDSG